MVVMKGEIVRLLCVDDGEETVLKKGDICVQRGRAYTWESRSDEWCCMLDLVLNVERTED
ncbi:predicted protein [Sclerotinia sclerotiorum 1980 UF-70]|uniref:(S)-ureidoglycine aminohydrolase cupin domain-containing protein n=1 Tax=Sclerotinia sclerotiorum (strain ATCC 18683 / 1980 / Ss-1) TaxID=665079 RepID=A7EQF9_SCLS1|nr:predicted protein [Sclerotinia sclerotiorum 1980 UF-70]EDN91701.1 predicted protein [Sclerotinia sclerotiorum 1980 UF-70]